MANLRLQEMLRPLVQELAPTDRLRAQRKVMEGFRDDGTLEDHVLIGSLPWQRADISIPGAAVAMSSAARVAFPQGGTIRHVSIYARTAPTSTYEVRVVSGSNSASVSLQAGSNVGMSSVSVAVPPGAWAIINVTNAGGAGDVMIILHYALSASGGSGSGGSGGGGGGGVGEVLSVNGETGNVVLNADHISDNTTSHKFVSEAERLKLQNIDLSNYVLASSLALVATTGDYNDLDNKPELGTAAAMDASAFATSAQGAKADTAVQPDDLGDLAAKDKVSVIDIDATGTPSSTTYYRGDGTWSTPPSSGGGGAVDSVNGQTGVVELDADDIDDTSTTHKFVTIPLPATIGTVGQVLKSTGSGITWQADANTIHSEIPEAEITAGSSATARAISGRRAQAIVNKAREGLYTQAQVDALIAANRPKVDSNAASMAVAVSSTGDHELTTAAITIPGLTPGASMKVIGEVMVRLIGTGSGGNAATGFKVSNGASTTTLAFNALPATTAGQSQQSMRYSTTITVPASGSVTLTPISRWSSGTYTVNYAMATLEIWPA